MERTYIINGKEYKVTINSISGNNANVTVNGTSYEVQIKDAPAAPAQPPYSGAKDMLLVEKVDDKNFLADLFRAIEPEMTVPKKKKHTLYWIIVELFSLIAFGLVIYLLLK